VEVLEPSLEEVCVCLGAVPPAESRAMFLGINFRRESCDLFCLHEVTCHGQITVFSYVCTVKKQLSNFKFSSKTFKFTQHLHIHIHIR